MAGNFFHSADHGSVCVENGILRARLRNERGDMCDAEIDLNHHIGNNDGRFEWGGRNFCESARDVTFHVEGDGQPILRAHLCCQGGNDWRPADVNLTERLINCDGHFEFQC